MPITNLLALGTTEVSSAEVTLTDGAGATLMLVGNGELSLEAKTSDGSFVSLGKLNVAMPVQQVFGPITFRAKRSVVVSRWVPAGQSTTPVAVGLDMDKA